MATLTIDWAAAPQTVPCTTVPDGAGGSDPFVPAATIRIVATLDAPVYPYAFDAFIAMPLAQAAALNGLKVHRVTTALRTVEGTLVEAARRSLAAPPQAYSVGIISLQYPGALVNPACAAEPARARGRAVQVLLPSDGEGAVLALQIEAYANTVLGPEALAAIQAYGGPTVQVPSSLVFSGVSYTSNAAYVPY